MILFIRTDTAVALIGLLKLDGAAHSVYHDQSLELGRDMARDLPGKIEDMLRANNVDWKDLDGLAAFRGPGSFTGLRIGCSIANSLAYGLRIPLVGATGDSWLDEAAVRLIRNDDDITVLPLYGTDAHTTHPKK